MIKVENLTKTYGRLCAVDGISFEVDVGDVMGFLGPNGAGKTTVMRILTGYFPPTSGRASVAGYDVVSQSYQVRRRIGYLPERVPLYVEMTVRTFLDFMHEIKRYPRSRKRADVDAAIERCGLESVEKRLTGNLSSGFRQRVGLAQALIGDPKVLILDEPTIGLDPVQVVEIRSLIKGMARERTIILSTHILSEVSMICNKVLIINRGAIARQGDLETLAAPSTGQRQWRVSVRGPEETVEKMLLVLEGIKAVERDGVKDGIVSFLVTADGGDEVRGEVARAMVEGGWDLLELRSAAPSLEEMFMEATVGAKGGSGDAA
jgi:ABC-2 type transport system ATP-binding protein